MRSARTEDRVNLLHENVAHWGGLVEKLSKYELIAEGVRKLLVKDLALLDLCHQNTRGSRNLEQSV